MKLGIYIYTYIYYTWSFVTFFSRSQCKFNHSPFQSFFLLQPIWRLGFCPSLNNQRFFGSVPPAGFSNGLATAPIASGPDIPTLVRAGGGGGRRGRTTMHEGMGKEYQLFFFLVDGDYWTFQVGDCIKGWKPFTFFFCSGCFLCFFWRDGKRFKLVYQGRCTVNLIEDW